MVEFWNWLNKNAEAMTFLALVPSGLFALWQWHKSTKVTRGEHLRQILMDVKDVDEDEGKIAKTFYKCIERLGTDGLPVVFYHGKYQGAPLFEGKYELQIDKMLMYFSLVCHERRLGIIDESEFTYFSYQIHRTLENVQIKSYMKDLCDFVASSGKGYRFMFTDLVNEGLSVDKEWYGEICKRIKQKSLIARFYEKLQEIM